MSVSVELVINNFPALSRSFGPAVEAALDAGVQVAIATADPLTPVDTGALRGNKTVERAVGSRTITWNQHYAAYQEFGTSRGVPAAGFARAGADAATPVIQAALRGWGG